MFPSFRLNMRALQVCYVFPFMISVFKKRQLHKYGALSPVQSRHSKSNNKSIFSLLAESIQLIQNILTSYIYDRAAVVSSSILWDWFTFF
ncbi:hypothetical protein AXX17_AT4G27810 [Arabidopsis thaliana]|uniref:Uncharacterized protein n=1 Tax=Arabidopsis thaliana TaxID=3702 RepID=A0A178V520_ARATH|nr:hypothetical protein AXX17_AT4G27810 [Arabidopsis thaliana]